MIVAIDHRDHIGADRGRGEVDHHLAGSRDHIAVRLVRARRSRVEHDADLRPDIELLQALDPFMRGRDAQPLRTRKPVG
jgi:hypothetical protein